MYDTTIQASIKTTKMSHPPNYLILLLSTVVLCYALVAVHVQVSLASVVSTGNFNQDFNILWAADNVKTSTDGHSRTIQLDNASPSGSGFGSNNKFLFGQYDMKIKLVPGFSAGIVVAYYLQSSDGSTRDEIDFEFLGNVKGEPIILQTNVFTNGQADREERITLWFDPTADFHTYTVHWNIHQLVFMVDWKPIRVYKNYVNQGVAYPNSRSMELYSTIWNASDWATNGGKDKLNMTYAPFVASFKEYKIDACVVNINDGGGGDHTRVCSGVSETNWWNKDKFKSLTKWQRGEYGWVRKNYLVYDYCQNPRKRNNFKECFLPKF